MADVERSFERMAKSTPFWREAPPASIDPSSIASSSLVVNVSPGTADDFTVTSTTHQTLEGTGGYMDVSGARDVRMDISCIAQPATGSALLLSVLVDGSPITDRIAGASTASAQFTTLSGHYTAPAGQIRPGRRLFAIGAYVTGGTGTVFCGDTNAVRLDVREVF